MDVRRISGPKTCSLGCFFALDFQERSGIRISQSARWQKRAHYFWIKKSPLAFYPPPIGPNSPPHWNFTYAPLLMFGLGRIALRVCLFRKKLLNSRRNCHYVVDTKRKLMISLCAGILPKAHAYQNMVKRPRQTQQHMKLLT